jgi:hypothetical protein
MHNGSGRSDQRHVGSCFQVGSKDNESAAAALRLPTPWIPASFFIGRGRFAYMHAHANFNDNQSRVVEIE